MALPKLEAVSAFEPTLRQTHVGRADFNLNLASGLRRSQMPKRTRVTSFVVPDSRQARCFLQRDPLGMLRDFFRAQSYYQDGMNLHGYVGSNPTWRRDAYGLDGGSSPCPEDHPVDMGRTCTDETPPSTIDCSWAVSKQLKLCYDNCGNFGSCTQTVKRRFCCTTTFDPCIICWQFCGGGDDGDIIAIEDTSGCPGGSDESCELVGPYIVVNDCECYTD